MTSLTGSSTTATTASVQAKLPVRNGHLLSAAYSSIVSRRIAPHATVLRLASMPPKPFDLTEPLAAAIRALLLSDWDPCSVNLNIERANEYDDYIPLIYRMAQKGESVVEIAARLNFIERSCIGLESRKELNRAIAGKIITLANMGKKR